MEAFPITELHPVAQDCLKKPIYATVQEIAKYMDEEELQDVSDHFKLNTLVSNDNKAIPAAWILLRLAQKYSKRFDAIKSDSALTDTLPLQACNVGGELETPAAAFNSTKNSPPTKLRKRIDVEQTNQKFLIPQWLLPKAKQLLQNPTKVSIHDVVTEMEESDLRFIAKWNGTVNKSNREHIFVIVPRIILHSLLLGTVSDGTSCVDVLQDQVDPIMSSSPTGAGYNIQSSADDKNWMESSSSSSSESYYSSETCKNADDEGLDSRTCGRKLTQIETEFQQNPISQLLHANENSLPPGSLIKYGEIFIDQATHAKITRRNKAIKARKVISVVLPNIYKLAALQHCSVGGTNRGLTDLRRMNRVKLAEEGIQGIIAILAAVKRIKYMPTESVPSANAAAAQTTKLGKRNLEAMLQADKTQTCRVPPLKFASSWRDDRISEKAVKKMITKLLLMYHVELLEEQVTIDQLAAVSNETGGFFRRVFNNLHEFWKKI